MATPTAEPWWSHPFAGLDFETTGVDTRKDRIVTSNTTVFTPRTPPPWELDHTHLLADPGVEIPEQATKVHGITTEYARQHGKPAEEVISVTAGLVAGLLAGGTPILGMNLSYDLSILWFECRRHGIQTLDDILGADNVGPFIDVYVIDMHYDRYRGGKRKLADLCTHYGVKHDGAHDAQQDVVASGRVAYTQLQRYPQLTRMSAWELHRAQIGWRRDQCARLQTYKQKTNPRAKVDKCWPVCIDPSH